MTFTELEYVLMIAVAVMLWRVSAMSRRIDWLVRRSDRYAEFLIQVGKKEGRIILYRRCGRMQKNPFGGARKRVCLSHAMMS